MKTRRKIALGVAVVAVLALTGLVLCARLEAHKFVTNPVNSRKVPLKTPTDTHLPFEDVTITNKEGLRLVAWYIPSQNGAAIIAQHGYKMCRDEMLPAAAALHKHDYGVLICSVRAHDRCDAEQLTFGIREVEDMKLWLDYLTTRPDVDTNRVAALGNSMGGSLVIQIAALDSRIKAVAADSAFSSADDTLATSVAHFTGLPAFPFAPLMRFWAKVETGCDFSQVNAKIWIKQISPRPVFLMQGGADTTVSRRSGELLYAAASCPKELWFEPWIGHAKFSTNMPAYELRVTAFFDRALSRRTEDLQANDPQAQGQIERRLGEIFGAAEAKEFDRLESYHLYGTKFTRFSGASAARLDGEATRKIERDGLEKLHGLRMKAEALKIDVFGATAIATFILDASFDSGDGAVHRKDRSTLVFVKESGDWKIAHEHLSSIPLAEPGGANQ